MNCENNMDTNLILRVDVESNTTIPNLHHTQHTSHTRLEINLNQCKIDLKVTL